MTLYNFLYPREETVEYMKITINGKIYPIVENYKFTQLNEKIFVDENGYISIENISTSPVLRDANVLLYFTKSMEVSESSLVYTMPKEILDICNNDMSTLDADKQKQIKSELGLFVQKEDTGPIPYFWCFKEPTELETAYNIHVNPTIEAKYLLPIIVHN